MIIFFCVLFIGIGGDSYVDPRSATSHAPSEGCDGDAAAHPSLPCDAKCSRRLATSFKLSSHATTAPRPIAKTTLGRWNPRDQPDPRAVGRCHTKTCCLQYPTRLGKDG